MKENQSFKVKSEEPRLALTLVPEEVLNSILTKQDKIIDLLLERKPPGMNGFMTEKEAIALVKKKSTWFWQMRKSGKLIFRKIGNTTYYSTEDISSLLTSD